MNGTTPFELRRTKVHGAQQRERSAKAMNRILNEKVPGR
jgi:hypothetical protein